MSLDPNPMQRESRWPHRYATVWVLISSLLFLSSCAEVPVARPSTNACEKHASLTNPGSGGIGGKGSKLTQNGSGGVGGTGIVALNNKPLQGEGGIGGTGIVGVITGFASICVNGVEVQYESNTTVSNNGNVGSTSQLAVGQVVIINSTGRDEQTKANSIAVIYALVGPVSKVDAATGLLEVMGQKVMALEPSDLVRLHAGEWVHVSGHRLSNGDVAASLIEAFTVPEASAFAQVRGSVKNIQAKTIKVGEINIHLDSLAVPTTLALGHEVWVSGIWSDGVLNARKITIAPTQAEIGQAKKVILEGYIHSLNEREINLGFQSIQLGDGVRVLGGTQAELAINRRVRVSGSVGLDKKLIANQVEFSNWVGSQMGHGRTGSMAGMQNSSNVGNAGTMTNSSNMGQSSGMSGSSSSTGMGGMRGSGGMSGRR